MIPLASMMLLFQTDPKFNGSRDAIPGQIIQGSAQGIGLEFAAIGHFDLPVRRFVFITPAPLYQFERVRNDRPLRQHE